ncbi:MAG: glycosyltransferase family 2 protein [Chloroflexi bacterium]|nr:glycosyltransferase family 2 protein [Chloroflexota bacterium]
MVAASIVIRVKNEGKTLATVLQAVHTQIPADYEVIIVDSGSTDDSLQIARAFNTRIIEIPEASFTYGYALNTGFAVARGELGVSLAGHAVPINNRWLAELLRPFSNPAVAGAVSRQIQHWWYRSWAIAYFDFLYRHMRLRSQAVVSRLYVNSSAAVRLQVWRENPFAEDLASCEDQLWGRQVMHLGYQLAYCPESLVNHWHRQSLAQKYKSVRRDMLAMRTVSRLLKKSD